LKVICPTEHEAHLLRRHLGRARLSISCCGPGPAAIERWLGTQRCAGCTVILAGVAGGLDPSLRAGSAATADRVIDLAGGCWRPDRTARPGHVGLTILSVQQVLLRVEEKAALFQRTGAHLADLESAAFARSAERAALSWSVVRGISDEATLELPGEIGAWVAPDGSVRAARAALWAVRAPSQLLGRYRLLRRLSIGADEAMCGVARRIREVHT